MQSRSYPPRWLEEAVADGDSVKQIHRGVVDGIDLGPGHAYRFSGLSRQQEPISSADIDVSSR